MPPRAALEIPNAAERQGAVQDAGQDRPGWTHRNGTNRLSVTSAGADMAGGPSTPGLAVPAPPSPDCRPARSRPAPRAGAWTASRAIGDGTGNPRRTMPLECPVSNTGNPATGWSRSWPGPCRPATWAPTWPSPTTRTTRGCRSGARRLLPRHRVHPDRDVGRPGAFAAKNVYMCPRGLPQPCYPAVMGITVIEIAGMSPYSGPRSPPRRCRTPPDGLGRARVAGRFRAPVRRRRHRRHRVPVRPRCRVDGPDPVTASGGGYSLARPAWRVLVRGYRDVDIEPARRPVRAVGRRSWS